MSLRERLYEHFESVLRQKCITGKHPAVPKATPDDVIEAVGRLFDEMAMGRRVLEEAER